MPDSEAFESIPGDPGIGLLLLADHARSGLPKEYGTLGLPAEAFRRHIAYDIGIEALMRALAARLGVPAVMSCFSRLLIDPNRGEDDPTMIMRISDGAIIPANHPLPEAERRTRLQRFHRPYHGAVDQAISAIANASGKAPLVISLHSFTPFWKNVARPWHAGVLWDRDPRAARALLDALYALDGVITGDNEPYDGALKGDTMYRHCTRTGMPHALLEVRQDLIETPAGVAEWCDRLAPIFQTLNCDPALHTYQSYGSRADA